MKTKYAACQVNISAWQNEVEEIFFYGQVINVTIMAWCGEKEEVG